jgi:hypothetical protein
MPRCAICGQESHLMSATDTSYICKICYEHLRFCASFDRVMCAATMPAEDYAPVERRAVSAHTVHAAATQRA